MVGRPNKPGALHDLQGTRQLCRHGKSGEGWNPEGPPSQVVRLTGEAAKFWDHIVPQLSRAGVATEVDSASLVAMCQHWAQWVECQGQLADLEPSDQSYYRLQIMASIAWKQFDKTSLHFGMTPAARMRLKGIGSGIEDVDPMDMLSPGRN